MLLIPEKSSPTNRRNWFTNTLGSQENISLRFNCSWTTKLIIATCWFTFSSNRLPEQLIRTKLIRFHFPFFPFAASGRCTNKQQNKPIVWQADTAKTPKIKGFAKSDVTSNCYKYSGIILLIVSTLFL